MATLVLGAAGAAIGGGLGGSVLGVGAAAIGRAAGATLGRMVDQRVLGAGADAIEHGRIDRFRLTGASEGARLPRVSGRVRVGGHVIWASRFRESSATEGGGKGAQSGPRVTRYSYSASFAMALCEGEVARIGRVWADGKEVARDSIQMRLHPGSEDQLPDALIEAVEGPENAPAFRGTAYVVIEALDLDRFGNRVPQLSFEVIRPVATETPMVADLMRGVALVPGTGEYALATTAVHFDYGDGVRDPSNVNTVQEISDFRVSMRDLAEELPLVGAASLVVCWFGDDLRAGQCTLQPRVEQNEVDGTPLAWEAGGVPRSGAGLVSTVDGRPVYGGTPSDASVVEAVREMAARGLAVTFYPFILMDQLAGNGRPDPWGAGEQAPLPWRGRITTEIAPGRPGTTDRSAAAEAEVATFFGTVRASDFKVGDGVVTYNGPDEFSYTRFILHYAALCASAGGIEGFCIGSEMRGLTRIRGAGDGFPAVARMVDLLEQVRVLLPDAKLGYAADWSEYFGYHPQDTGDVHFHLDPLWSHPDCDFVGIDNYMPLSDWRDGAGHLDAAWSSVLDQGYLRANVEGGEGFDWYYPNKADRDAQNRVPITDGAHEEPWVFRYKDLRGWWENAHHDRIGGARQAAPTGWVPRSKPFRFMEYGCAAIDKGANQPNKFQDPKSSESQLPWYSDGRRDDAMQEAYLRAFLTHWEAPSNNPVSPVYGGRMVDLDRSFAWAWDVRPWPAFPELVDYWSDGPNHARGHWINGRTGNQPLDAVVAELCREGGLDGVDVSKVRGLLRGQVAMEMQSVRADLQSLCLAYGIDVFEREGQVVLQSRDEARVVDLTEAELVRGDGPVMSVRRDAEAEVPGTVRVHRVSAEGAFEAKVSDAVRPGTGGLPVASSEVPLVLSAGEGQAMAERAMADAVIGRESVRLSLPPSRREVAPGDLLRFDGSDATWRVDRLSDGEARHIEATRVEASSWRGVDMPDRPGGGRRPAVAMPVEALMLDLPILPGDGTVGAPHVALAARPWPGAVAIHSASEDAGYRFNALVEESAVIGSTLTALPAAAPDRWDRGPALLVRLPGGRPSSSTQSALLAGRNALAIGAGGVDGWEVMQFLEAVPVEADVWSLSVRLRGQRGTEAVMPDAWPVGSRVVLLDGRTTQIDMPEDARGLSRHYRFGPARLPLDHETYRHAVAAAHGVGARPFAPVHLTVTRGEAGLNARWVRRSRLFRDGWDAVEVPLAEQRELYEVTLWHDGVRLYRRAVSEPGIEVSAAALSDSGIAAGAFELRVAQVSDLVGPGHPARIIMT